MKLYGDTTVNRQGCACRCGMYRCDPPNDPYCQHSAIFCGNRGASNYCASEPTPPDGRSLVAEFDARAALRREQTAAEFQAFDRERTAAKKAERKGRSRVPSKKELRLRAAEREGRAISPAWLLDESDPMLDAAMKAED